MSNMVCVVSFSKKIVRLHVGTTEIQRENIRLFYQKEIWGKLRYHCKLCLQTS